MIDTIYSEYKDLEHMLSYKADFVSLFFEDFLQIVCTEDEIFYTDDNIEIKAKDLTEGAVCVLRGDKKRILCKENIAANHIKEKFIERLACLFGPLHSTIIFNFLESYVPINSSIICPILGIPVKSITKDYIENILGFDEKAFYNKYPEFSITEQFYQKNNQYSIWASTGWEKFDGIFKNVYSMPIDMYRITLKTGQKISCTYDHKLFDEEFNEIEAQSIGEFDYIQTESGPIAIEKIEQYKSDISYSVFNSESKRIYSNGILSRNCDEFAFVPKEFCLDKYSKVTLRNKHTGQVFETTLGAMHGDED